MGITITSVTPQQRIILKHLATFRFLNRYHIQTLLKHKDSRLINAWLKYLTENHLVGRIYSNTFGENTKPAIYYLLPKSTHFLGKLDGISPETLKWVYRERGRSRRFVDHCQVVADLYLSVMDQFKGQVHFFTKTDLSTLTYVIKPTPDAYIASEHEGETKRYFLEVIDEGTPRFALRKRIVSYFEYAEDKTWETATTHPFPSVLVICPDDIMKNYMYRLIKGIGSNASEPITFFVSLKSPIKWQEVK